MEVFPSSFFKIKEINNPYCNCNNNTKKNAVNCSFRNCSLMNFKFNKIKKQTLCQILLIVINHLNNYNSNLDDILRHYLNNF